MSRYQLIYSLRTSWQVVDAEADEGARTIVASGCCESHARQIADHFNGVCARTLDNAIKERDEARAIRPVFWFDAGYLNNGHCSFMRSRDGASCCGSHGHAGEHHYP